MGQVTLEGFLRKLLMKSLGHIWPRAVGERVKQFLKICKWSIQKNKSCKRMPTFAHISSYVHLCPCKNTFYPLVLLRICPGWPLAHMHIFRILIFIAKDSNSELSLPKNNACIYRRKRPKKGVIHKKITSIDL